MITQTPRAQMYSQARYTFNMTQHLPAFAAGDQSSDLPGAVVNACLEAFFMNVRAITDFLGCRPNGRQRATDFSAVDVVPGWTHNAPEAAARLETHWVTASQLIAHFSRNRIQEPANPDYVDTSYAALTLIAEDVRTVWQTFEDAYRKSPS